ncbi:hypothetical protein ACN469_26780 [Corallococcus terminator]
MRLLPETLISFLVLCSTSALWGCDKTASGRQTPEQSQQALKVAGGERINAPTAFIVRGMNGTTCGAQSIGAGSTPQVNVTTEVQNLSVSCSEDRKVTLDMLRKPLVNPHICWAKLEELEARSADIIVSTDPTGDNPYHCVVSDITPNQMVQALHYRN